MDKLKVKALSEIKKKLFLSCVIWNHKLYFISEAELILMEMDTSSGEIKYIDNSSISNNTGCLRTKWKLSDWMLAIEKNIYILESDGMRMIEYHVQENTCRYFDINCNVYVCSNYAGFTVYKDKAYIFPSFLNELVIVNLKSGEVKHKEKLCENICYTPNLNEPVPQKLFSCGCRIENSEWIFMERKKEVIEYNLQEGYVRSHKLPDLINGCVHAEWKDDLFYILDLEGKLYTWDIQTGNVEAWLVDEVKPYPNYREMVVTNKKIWILPETGDDILSIDKETRKAERYYKYPSDFVYTAPDYYSKYYVHCEDKENYYFSMHSGNYIFCVEKESGKERWIRPIFPNMENILDYYKKNSMYINEWEYYLCNYIRFIKNEDSALDRQIINIGERIWRGMK